MRGEIYVLSMLKASETAHNVVISNLRGQMVTDNVRAELTSPARRHLAGARYEHLASKLVEAFRPAPPPRFAEADLRRLLRTDVRQELSRVLRCPPDDALASLFDPVPMSRDLGRVQRPGVSPGDVEQLLYALLNDGAQRVRMAFQFSENDWGSHIQRRGWLQPAAIDQLREEAVTRGWTRNEPGRALQASSPLPTGP